MFQFFICQLNVISVVDVWHGWLSGFLVQLLDVIGHWHRVWEFFTGSESCHDLTRTFILDKYFNGAEELFRQEASAIFDYASSGIDVCHSFWKW